MSELYLICKYGAYYRPNAQGYTTVVAEAGRYTLDEAIKHSHPNGPDGPRDGITYIPDPTPTPTADQPEGAIENESEVKAVKKPFSGNPYDIPYTKVPEEWDDLDCLPDEHHPAYIEGREKGLKEAEQIAVEMRKVHGSSTGDAYRCGAWDQGVRIAAAIRSTADSRNVAALSTKPESVKGEHSLFDDFGCEFDDDCYVIRWQSGDGHMDSLTAFRSGKIIATRSPFSDDTPPTSQTFDSLLYTQRPTPASGDQMAVALPEGTISKCENDVTIAFDNDADAVTAFVTLEALMFRPSKASRELCEELTAATERAVLAENRYRHTMAGQYDLRRDKEAAEALNTTLSEALKAHDEYMLESGYAGPHDSALHPKAAANWYNVRTALAALPAKQGGHSDEA